LPLIIILKLQIPNSLPAPAQISKKFTAGEQNLGGQANPNDQNSLNNLLRKLQGQAKFKTKF